MSKVRELHSKAMELAHLSMVARHTQDWDRAESLAREAHLYESQAAELVPEGQASEPTRSILYRSAASLAYQCKDFRAAQRLIAKGLSGYPTPQVEQELKDLYEQVNFEHHLQVRGITLGNEDFQLALQGKSVGSGTILYDELVRRFTALRTVIDRTMERMMGAKYQRSRRASKTFRPFIPALSAARQGSFAITIKLAVAQGEQIQLLVTPAQVIDEIMTGVELINDSKEEQLQTRLKERGYYKNFVSLVKDIAPDGERITFVGLTSSTRAVSLIRQRKDIEIKPGEEPTEVEPTPITVEGILDYATARKQPAIGLTAEDGKQYDVIVGEGLEDLVRSYFGQSVVVTGLLDQKSIYLTDVEQKTD